MCLFLVLVIYLIFCDEGYIGVIFWILRYKFVDILEIYFSYGKGNIYIGFYCFLDFFCLRYIVIVCLFVYILY